jgi:MFS family permease
LSAEQKKDLSRLWRALGNRDYNLFFWGQGPSTIGTWIQNIAMSWLIFQMTGSAWMLGMVAFLSQIPNFFLAPVAGVLVDRWIKQRVLLTTQFLSLVQAGILTLLTFNHLLETWHLLLLSLLLGCINAFDIPARHAITAELVENKEDKANAIALNSITYNIARFVGPSIAGLLIPIFGEGMCFLLNTVSYLMAIFSLLLLKPRTLTANQKQEDFLQCFQKGYQYTFGQLPLKLILLLLGVVSLMGTPYIVLLPIYVVQELYAGADLLGFLMAASGLGSLVGAIFLAARTSFQGLEKLLAIAATLIGMGLALLAFIKILYVSLMAMFLIGLGLLFTIVGSSTLLQCMVDDTLRARVMSFYTMTFMGIGPVGSLIAGGLAQSLGTSYTLLGGGVACLCGAAYFHFHLSAFRVQACPIYVNSGNLDSVEQCRFR